MEFGCLFEGSWIARSPTSVINCEHFGDFGVESVDSLSGGSLPNDTKTREVVESIELLQTKATLQQKQLVQMLECD